MSGAVSYHYRGNYSFDRYVCKVKVTGLNFSCPHPLGDTLLKMLNKLFHCSDEVQFIVYLLHLVKSIICSTDHAGSEAMFADLGHFSYAAIQVMLTIFFSFDKYFIQVWFFVLFSQPMAMV